MFVHPFLPLMFGNSWGDGPASFDCAMRKLAYTFGRQQIPRMGEFESLYYALDLNSPDCNVRTITAQNVFVNGVRGFGV